MTQLEAFIAYNEMDKLAHRPETALERYHLDLMDARLALMGIGIYNPRPQPTFLQGETNGL